MKRVAVSRDEVCVPAFRRKPVISSSPVWPHSVLFELHRLPPMRQPAAIGISHGLVINLDHPLEVTWKKGSSAKAVLFPRGGLCLGSPNTEIPEFSWTSPVLIAVVHVSPELFAGATPPELGCALATVDLPILSLVQSMRTELEQGAPHGAMGGESLGHRLAIYLQQHYGRTGNTKRNWGGLGSRRIRLLTEHIREHQGNPLTLSELAGITDLSVFHFARSFRKEFGVSPCRFLQDLRIRRAKELLRRTSVDQKEISRQLGFSNASHFVRVFKANTGETPGQYRKQRRASVGVEGFLGRDESR
ncbi:MAG: helix-turn-helix transcriptional regulator [Verrucomicrobia bacterium]|nr:helix-turn-helix transcriptional regulator [Verrucomicrobiota bacterium]